VHTLSTSKYDTSLMKCTKHTFSNDVSHIDVQHTSRENATHHSRKWFRTSPERRVTQDCAMCDTSLRIVWNLVTHTIEKCFHWKRIRRGSFGLPKSSFGGGHNCERTKVCLSFEIVVWAHVMNCNHRHRTRVLACLPRTSQRQAVAGCTQTP